MKRTRVKVCGMRKPEQVKELIELGVDAIGMIFYDSSPRNVTIEEAICIRKVVPPFVSLTGVFVDTDVEDVNQVSQQVGLNLVQLHGDQDSEFGQKLNVPYVRAIRVDNMATIDNECRIHSKAHGFLLDTYSTKSYGGTGSRINPQLLPENLSINTILAGGINPDNILDILVHKPYAIDINSGVEFSPANKNIEAVRSILKAVRQVDGECF